MFSQKDRDVLMELTIWKGRQKLINLNPDASVKFQFGKRHKRRVLRCPEREFTCWKGHVKTQKREIRCD